MPVTAKLSRRFYETFGDELTNELVEWFNAVDLAYRSDLRDYNDLNFARFDAKLEQRLTQSEARTEQRLVELEAKLEQRLTQSEARTEQRLVELEARMERRFAEFDIKLADLRRDLETRTISLRADLARDIARVQVTTLRWMFLFWIGTVATIILAR
jgi:DNA anti-recombination protein RmuC